MSSSFAEGSWLTRDRVRMVATLSGSATILILVFLLATGSGHLDRFGRPLGTDFSNVWTAGRMALEGNAAAAWNWNEHYQVQQELHGSDAVPFYGWHYPPPFLLLASLLGLLPYLAALLLWQASSLAGAALVLRHILPHRDTLLVGLGAPVTFVCLSHGHNGFLTAVLLGGGLALLDRRPFAAGILLGCLVYKPQFALMIPPLLIVMRSWRGFAGAALSASALILTTLAIWGGPVWSAFLGSLEITRTVVIESGSTGWHKIQSPFAMARMWGAEIGPAYTVQGMLTVAAIGSALWAARAGSPAPRNAAAIAAALISTPYLLDYDLVPLGLAVAFLAADGLKRGFLSYEKSLLALVWLAPLLARQVAELLLLPVGLLSAIIVLSLALRRAAAFDGAEWPLLRSSPSRR
jgi:hypothetical protein